MPAERVAGRLLPVGLRLQLPLPGKRPIPAAAAEDYGRASHRSLHRFARPAFGQVHRLPLDRQLVNAAKAVQASLESR